MRHGAKAIGLALFLWLLARIDRQLLLTQLWHVDISLLIVSLMTLLLSYALKVIRWEMLIAAAGLPTGVRFAWETYNVGTFLGMITPGKVGEFGRVGYLHRAGMSVKKAIAVVFIDRLFDVAIIALLSIIAAYILFGLYWLMVGVSVFLLGSVAVTGSLFWFRRMESTASHMSFLHLLFSRPKLLVALMALTVCSWLIYCAWSVLLLWSMGVNVSLLPFMSAIIFAGIIALLPIAPSGLGTRDASLIWLLHPLGIGASQAVALSFLMFVSIVVSSLIGAWYWVRGVSSHSR